ncbi:MAG: beta-ketoacyl-ACP synthase II [Phycisphaerales bacterium]
MNRVVITGLGAVSPAGSTVATMWDAMLAGRSGIGPLTRFDCDGYATQIAGQVDDFDVDARVGRREARRVGRFTAFALAAADDAMQDAGFPVGEKLPNGDRVATYVGTGIGGLPEIADGVVDYAARGPKGVSPFFIPRSLNNLAGGNIAIRYGARGPSLCISTACAVGNHNIGEAWRLLAMGDADMAIAGGTEASLTPVGICGFQSMRALSRRNDDPKTASRPFDANRDGFVMGEGAGIVVLESLDHALARGATPLAEIAGYGSTADAYRITDMHPEGRGPGGAIRRALDQAGIDPHATGDDGRPLVDYISAHGTGTSENDKVETRAVKAVFGDNAPQIPMSSIKSMMGHLIAAAGAVELIVCAMAIRNGIVPPTINLHEPDPELDLDYVPNAARKTDVRTCLSNSFGFGGQNDALILRRFEE